MDHAVRVAGDASATFSPLSDPSPAAVVFTSSLRSMPQIWAKRCRAFCSTVWDKPVFRGYFFVTRAVTFSLAIGWLFCLPMLNRMYRMTSPTSFSSSFAKRSDGGEKSARVSLCSSRDGCSRRPGAGDFRARVCRERARTSSETRSAPLAAAIAAFASSQIPLMCIAYSLASLSRLSSPEPSFTESKPSSSSLRSTTSTAAWSRTLFFPFPFPFAGAMSCSRPLPLPPLPPSIFFDDPELFSRETRANGDSVVPKCKGAERRSVDAIEEASRHERAVRGGLREAREGGGGPPGTYREEAREQIRRR